MIFRRQNSETTKTAKFS